MAGRGQLKMVGSRKWPVFEISIAQPPRGAVRKGVYRTGWADPYLPKRITDPYHPGGNSVCYMIQTAHLMGCDPIFLLGFTLSAGTPYFFGRQNPVTRRPSFYDEDRALHWLKWYETEHPGRARLMPGWDGPIYRVLRTERIDDG